MTNYCWLIGSIISFICVKLFIENMQDEHRKAIQNIFTSLVEQTDLNVMVSALYEKGVFSERMIEPYRDTSVDERQRKRLLYLDIPRRGPDAFDKLVEALTEAGYWDLARDLDPNSSLHTNSTRKHINNNSGSNYVSLRKKPPKVPAENSVVTPRPPPAPPTERPLVQNPTAMDVADLVVIKSTKFYEDEEELRVYRTRGRQRGLLVVFNYCSFQQRLEASRRGVERDCDRLKHVFGEMGFKTISFTNLDYDETVNNLKGLRKQLVGFDCAFLMVSSHGYQAGGRAAHSPDNDFRCHDNRLMSCYEFIDYFNNVNCPELRGVPKVFLFQLCRGVEDDSITSPYKTDGGPRSEIERDRVPNGAGDALRLKGGEAGGAGDAVERDGAGGAGRGAAEWRPPADAHDDRVYSDILIAHSTIPGTVARRDPVLGSWFVQALCSVLAARAHAVHVDQLLKLVDQRLSQQFGRQTSSVDRWGFNRLLYLHPGIYEDEAGRLRHFPAAPTL